MQKSKIQHTRSSFGRVRKLFWRVCCLVRFPRPPPPYFLIPRLCRADWGEFFNWPGKCLENSLANVSANLMAFFFVFLVEFFGLVFPGLQVPPKNLRPNLSAFLSNFTFSNPKCFHAASLLAVESNTFCAPISWPKYCEVDALLEGPKPPQN